jgi:hypothetical protein
MKGFAAIKEVIECIDSEQADEAMSKVVGRKNMYHKLVGI